MPIYKGRVTIKRGGRYHPPGTLHDLSEDEAKALGPSRVVFAGGHVSAVLAPAMESTGAAITSDAPSSDVGSPDNDQKDGASHRVAEIAAALDLLEEGDFIKNGKRKGKPKQSPIEEIVGFDVTSDEIDAALALREAGL